MRVFKQNKHNALYNTVAAAVAVTIQSGGCTMDIHAGGLSKAQTGYFVGVRKLHQGIVSRIDFHSLAYQLEAMDDVKLLGGWIDRETREICLDVVQHFNDRDQAMQAAVKNNEKAIWDIAEKQEIMVNP